MTTARRTVEFLAALLVGATAGWALLAPLASSFSVGGSDGEVTAMMTSRPLAAAIGVVLAAAVAGAMSRRRSTRAARVVTLVGLGLLVAVLLTGDGVRQVEWLIASNWVSGIAAGLALGGTAAAIVDRTDAVALTGGAFASFLLVAPITEQVDAAPALGWIPYAPLTDASSLTVPPAGWLVLPATVATAFAVALGSTRPARESHRGVAVTAAVVATGLVTNAAIAAAQDNRTLTWVLLTVFVAVVIAAAFALDEQDGTLLLTITAIVATAAPLTGWSATTWVGVAILAVGLAVGTVAGARWPGVVVGLTLLAAVSVVGLLPNVADGMGGAVRALALAPIAGYALGSCGRARAGATTAGLSVLFVPSALTVAGQASADLLTGRSPLRSLPRGWSAAAPPDPQALTLTMTVVTLATIAAAGMLRQRGD